MLLEPEDHEEEEASMTGSIEGSQLSKHSRLSRASYELGIASPTQSPDKDKEEGKKKKLSAAEKLKRKKEKMRILKEAQERLEEVGNKFQICAHVNHVSCV